MLSKIPQWYKTHRAVVYWQTAILLSMINPDWIPMKEELERLVK